MALSRWQRECSKPSLGFSFLRKCGVGLQEAPGNNTHLKRGGFLEEGAHEAEAQDLSSFRELGDRLGGASHSMGQTEGKRHIQISSVWP